MINDAILVEKLLLVRQQTVVLDSDLAQLYGVPTKRINEQLKRNRERFPMDFAFQLYPKEWEALKSQNATSSWGGRRTPPWVFTEHGILMLSSVLNSPQALAVNIQIMRLFVRLRQWMKQQDQWGVKLEQLEQAGEKRDKQLTLIFQFIQKMEEQKQQQEDFANRKRIGFK